MSACPSNEGGSSLEDATATADESSSSTGTTFDPVTTGPDAPPTTGEPDATTSTSTSTSTSGSTSTSTTDPPPSCGDGMVDPGEECDEGDANDNEGTCTEGCTKATCGDGFLQRGEECDLGPSNDNEGECTNLCTLPVCGDGFIQPGEACDDGEGNDADIMGACHPETCQIVTTCGDGVVQEDEECDPEAEGEVAAVCSEQCLIYRKVIFASSAVYYGDLLGLTEADTKCKELAAAAELPNDGAFIAWLSTPKTPMSGRILPTPVKYVRSDGAPIAEGWDDLIDGTLTSAISKDEHGADATKLSAVAWTGTEPDGGANPSNCNLWTSDGIGSEGLTGWLTATDDKWTKLATNKCGFQAHLYCIET
ncbi:MAG: hypothetical protein R3B09_10415 [Nannocystaceae bacterium]